MAPTDSALTLLMILVNGEMETNHTTDKEKGPNKKQKQEGSLCHT